MPHSLGDVWGSRFWGGRDPFKLWGYGLGSALPGSAPELWKPRGRLLVERRSDLATVCAVWRQIGKPQRWWLPHGFFRGIRRPGKRHSYLGIRVCVHLLPLSSLSLRDGIAPAAGTPQNSLNCARLSSICSIRSGGIRLNWGSRIRRRSTCHFHSEIETRR